MSAAADSSSIFRFTASNTGLSWAAIGDFCAPFSLFLRSRYDPNRRQQEEILKLLAWQPCDEYIVIFQDQGFRVHFEEVGVQNCR